MFEKLKLWWNSKRTPKTIKIRGLLFENIRNNNGTFHIEIIQNRKFKKIQKEKKDKKTIDNAVRYLIEEGFISSDKEKVEVVTCVR